MPVTSPLIVEGFVTDDGQLQVPSPLPLPPGPVRITLQWIKPGERLPDPPWLDGCISAPFDLPHSGKIERLRLKEVTERLPPPIIVDDDDDNDL